MPGNLSDVFGGAMAGSTTTPAPGEQPKALRRVKAKNKKGDVFVDDQGRWYVDESGLGESFPSQKEAEAALVKEQQKGGK